MKQILNSIQEQLSKISEVNYAGEDWGQLDEERPPVKFPCALVDMDQFQYSDMGEKTQMGEGIIQITVADIKLQGNRPTAQMNRVSDHDRFMTVLEKVHEKLHGYGTAEFQPLKRVSMAKIKRTDGIRSYVISYETAYTDRVATTKYTKKTISGININL
ncbi:hypothetical protein [Flammeovirga sp. OC4]|uniref:hypothetical protein n=1 Tax=Flammeovirga sp. OC4 TaxID=1382345 RepID=UPI00069346FD|nr:hypothetical protein [Flammeovirga sp. OC4]